KSILLLCIISALICFPTFSFSLDTPQSDDESPKEVRCGRILVRGSEQLTQPELCRLLEGISQSMADSQLLVIAGEYLIKEYRRRGFLDATVAWGTTEHKAGSSAPAPILTITEGPVYHVRKLEMMGNTTTRDWVIRRRVALNEDAPFDEELLELS